MLKEKQNVSETMKDEIYDQRTVAFSQNCYKRGIEAKDATWNKIENINNKMLQSIEEKDKTTMESLEEKKEISFAHLRESNRIGKK